MMSKTGPRVLGWGLLSAAWCASLAAQDPIKAYPQNYKLVLENSAVAVIRVHYGAHEKVGVHDHSNYPTIYIYLSDSGPVRFAHFEEKAFTTVRPPAHVGAFRVAPARPERHTVENLGDIPSDFLRVELKQAKLRLKSPFRGGAPATLASGLDAVEFQDGPVTIERVVCIAGMACSLTKEDSASLLVAITPLLLDTALQGEEKIEAGRVLWMKPGDALSVKQDSAMPAHLLRIVVPED